MQAGQKMKRGGIECCLFPLSYMYITQGENGSTSHQGSLAIDFAGWGINGRILKCVYYAPFSCKLVAKFGTTSPLLIWESINPVLCIDGTITKVCIGVAHDDQTPMFYIGMTRNQGDILGHTGTYGNVTGDHVHMEVCKGAYTGCHQNSSGVWVLNNQEHIYNVLAVNGTTIVQGNNYPWELFMDFDIGGLGKFPWVLYSKKLRERRKVSRY